jgi:hypothetical protein
MKDVKVENTPNYLHILVTSEFSVALAYQVIDLSIEKCKEINQNRVLLDVREMMGTITLMDKFYVGSHASKLWLHRIQTAMIGRKNQITVDNFLESFLVSRGVNVRVFTEREAGIKWLERS